MKGRGIFHLRSIMAALACMLLPLSLSAWAGALAAAEEHTASADVDDVEDAYTLTYTDALADTNALANTDALVDANTTITGLDGQEGIEAADDDILISPFGEIDTRSPTYSWNEVDGSLWYLLEVEDQSGPVIEQWYRADEITEDSICEVTPQVVLSPGDHVWRVQTWSCDDDDTISEDMEFSVCASTVKPGKATLISPKGTIGTFTPTFTWNPVADCSRYCLKISDSSGILFSDWFDADEVTADTVCLLISPVELESGDYTWQIRSGNCVGDGPWSAIASFKITNKAPSRPTASMPRGLISTRTPKFTWSAAPGSTQYNLQVENDTEVIMDEWFLAEQVTSGQKCSVLSPMILPDDDVDFYWRVKAINDIGDSPWSSYKYFEVVCGAAGPAKGQKARDQKMQHSFGKSQRKMRP